MVNSQTFPPTLGTIEQRATAWCFNRGCEEAGKAKEVGSQLNQKIPRGAAPVDLIGSPLTRCDGSEWANHRIQIW